MNTDLHVPLSVLDVAPVSEGFTPRDALRNSLDLAPRVERLGFNRYWVAEHHNMPGIASSAPAVLLAQIASVTSTIRVGSGGVMLPNHSSLVAAEQFGMLEALHPGRVDLGIGRAPGTDQLTAHALRRAHTGADDFPEQLVELLGYFEGRWPADHPYRAITATPGLGYRPEVWMLGSSDYGAQAAGLLGLPYSFAHHFGATNTMAAIRTYREAFRPGGAIEAPHLMLGVSVVCAETDEHAQWLAAPGALSFVRLRSARPGRFPTPEEAVGVRVLPARASTAGRAYQLPDHRGAGDRARRAAGPLGAHPRGRADHHHGRPRPRRPSSLVRPRGGGRRAATGGRDHLSARPCCLLRRARSGGACTPGLRAPIRCWPARCSLRRDSSDRAVRLGMP